MNVANTIFQQIGGSKFVAMTGAKNFLGGNNYLAFSIPTTKNINKIKISLNSNDLYDIEFGNIRKLEYKIISKKTDIYFDMLEDIFTQETGLYTRL